jgi:hypothetical protein
MRIKGMSLNTCQYIGGHQRDMGNTYKYADTKELADHPPRVNTEKPLVNRISRQATNATTEL